MLTLEFELFDIAEKDLTQKLNSLQATNLTHLPDVQVYKLNSILEIMNTSLSFVHEIACYNAAWAALRNTQQYANMTDIVKVDGYIALQNCIGDHKAVLTDIAATNEVPENLLFNYSVYLAIALLKAIYGTYEVFLANTAKFTLLASAMVEQNSTSKAADLIGTFAYNAQSKDFTTNVADNFAELQKMDTMVDGYDKLLIEKMFNTFALLSRQSIQYEDEYLITSIDSIKDDVTKVVINEIMYHSTNSKEFDLKSLFYWLSGGDDDFCFKKFPDNEDLIALHCRNLCLIEKLDDANKVLPNSYTLMIEPELASALCSEENYIEHGKILYGEEL